MAALTDAVATRAPTEDPTSVPTEEPTREPTMDPWWSHAVTTTGAYVYGASGSNECPAGSARIETEAACRTAAAAAAAGKTFWSTNSPSYYPRGCIYSIKQPDVAVFNTAAVGAGHSDAQLLCAVSVTTGSGAGTPTSNGTSTGATTSASTIAAVTSRPTTLAPTSPTPTPTEVPTTKPPTKPTEVPTTKPPTKPPTSDPTAEPKVAPTAEPSYTPAPPGAYVSGASGSNECPAGSVRIETEAACKNAAAALGKDFFGALTSPKAAAKAPRGCILIGEEEDVIMVMFNTDAVGAGNSDTQLLCAATVTTA